jgi:hypothetical protein
MKSTNCLPTNSYFIYINLLSLMFCSDAKQIANEINPWTKTACIIRPDDSYDVIPELYAPSSKSADEMTRVLAAL